MSKYIVVVGGVYSGTGKGISAASIGLLLRLRGHSVQYIKCDPYLNINAGTMNPTQHGEVFLCDDGSETDLDLGHIERIIGTEMSCDNIFTSGTLYKELLQDEIDGKFLGESVQIIPHVTNKIQDRFLEVGKDSDITIVEIGGTVGDFESGALFEAVRQFKHSNPNDVVVVMVAPVIWNNTVEEFKTKPLQNSVRTLQSMGLRPDILMCRVDREIPSSILEKISQMTGIPMASIFDAPDVESIYEVPIKFWERSIDDYFVDYFKMRRTGCRLTKYKELVERYIHATDLPTINIGVICKYKNTEAYISLKEALNHASVANNVRCSIKWILTESLESTDYKSLLDGLDGVIVPGGFDYRGVEGKINAVNYCRENKIPFLGICLGLQCAVIEFCRNVIGMAEATSEEFSKVKSENNVIEFVDGQENMRSKSGTMRLGSYDCELQKGSIARTLYGKKTISERHRHRYEVSSSHVAAMAEAGFVVSGTNPESGLVEIMELSSDIHPFFVGTQAHPEFKSRLGSPSPLFMGLVQSALDNMKGKENESTGLPDHSMETV